jgi:hypothetical protein
MLHLFHSYARSRYTTLPRLTPLCSLISYPTKFSARIYKNKKQIKQKDMVSIRSGKNSITNSTKKGV